MKTGEFNRGWITVTAIYTICAHSAFAITREELAKETTIQFGGVQVQRTSPVSSPNAQMGSQLGFTTNVHKNQNQTITVEGNVNANAQASPVNIVKPDSVSTVVGSNSVLSLKIEPNLDHRTCGAFANESVIGQQMYADTTDLVSVSAGFKQAIGITCAIAHKYKVTFGPTAGQSFQVARPTVFSVGGKMEFKGPNQNAFIEVTQQNSIQYRMNSIAMNFSQKITDLPAKPEFAISFSNSNESGLISRSNLSVLGTVKIMDLDAVPKTLRRVINQIAD
jgi:hypothetical protein